MSTRPSRTLLFVVLLGCGGAAAAGPTDSLTPVEAAVDAQRITVGSRTRGELTPSDRADDSGHIVDAFDLDLDADQLIRIRVPADALDPVLRVTGPEEFSIENDDALPNTLDSWLQFSAPLPGTYRVEVTTAPAGQTGPYVLEVSVPEVVGQALSLGGRIDGTLGQVADPAFAGHSFYQFHGDGGAILRLRVTSRDFDTIATVVGPRGDMWVNDDANDLGPDGSERALDSTVFVAIPESGTYQLIVSSYAPMATGAFAVTTSVRPPVIVHTGETVPSGPFAGPEGRGRVLGLYVGITEYQTHSRLYGCADDATLMGQAMRSAHLQRVDEQIILTDAAATREAFLGGLRTLATRAQPDDVVVIFYSGHGNVQPVPAEGDPIELDGLDETVVMVDGQVTDTEVAHELLALHSGTLVFALDSCHAGGFADDVIRQPGRMGIFSSDEDVLSDTAEPRRAGGYVSWYLRRGVLGVGDYKPHDGVLYAGELTDFMYEGFVTDHRFMNPEGHLDPAQRLVIRRGSVGWNNVLWVYPRGEDLRIPALPDVSLESSPP